MPPGHFLATAPLAGPSTRKRSYAEITRSESHSTSPEIPSKRRLRTLRSSSVISSQSSLIPSSSNDSSPMQSPPHSSRSTPRLQARRTTGDGLDWRRPLPDLDPNQYTIDLTADDSTPPSPPTFPELESSSSAPRDSYRRAPTLRNENIEIIALSDSDDEVHPSATVRFRGNNARQSLPRPSLSPDVEFVSERPARPIPGNNPASRNNAHVQPPQQAREDPGDQTYLGFGHIFRSIPAAFNRIARRTIVQDTVPQYPRITYVGAPTADDFEEIHLDYQQPAFAMGARESEIPQIGTEPYKEPPAPREGFTRNIEEDEMLVCPLCGDELASGEGEVKQQVWVIKQCGHVYCGECATHRSVTTKKDRKNGRNRTPPTFKFCKVDGCEKSVQSRASMFQVYL